MTDHLQPGRYMWASYHAEFLHAVAYSATTSPSLYETVKALGNIRLAFESDVEELQLAVNPEIAYALYDADACWRGLSTVGLQATDWYDLGRRIALAKRSDWLAWVRDSNHDEIDLHAVEMGFVDHVGQDPDEEFGDENEDDDYDDY